MRDLSILLLFPACLSLYLGNHEDCTPEPPKEQVATQSPTEAGVCTTEQCVQHARRITVTMDSSVNPCDDFYQYSCGGWIQTHTIPQESALYGYQAALQNITHNQLKELLEQGSTDKDPVCVHTARSLYTSCTDEDGIEASGTAPLLTHLDQYGGWPLLEQGTSPQISLENLVAKVIRGFVNVIITPAVMADMRAPEEMIMYFSETSLSMGTRDFYLKGINTPTVVAYRTLITNVARDLGADPTTVDNDVDDIIKFEVKLANATADPASRLDYNSLYHKRTFREMAQLYPWMDWLTFAQKAIDGSGVHYTEDSLIIDLASPYFDNLGPLLGNTSMRVIRNYVVWRFIQSRLYTLPRAFREYGQDIIKVVYGTRTSIPRWKSCILKLNRFIPLVLGRIYVQEHFNEKSKSNTEEALVYLREAFEQRLESRTWMDDQTRQAALRKLENIRSKVAYPDEIYNNTFLDQMYPLGEVSGNYFEDYGALIETSVLQTLAKLLKPVDRNGWMKSPAEVNGYYSLTQNEIVILAAILQPPNYFSGLPNYINYGSIASIIGHELTHGFDSKGRLFDENGNLRQWWSNDVISAFNSQATCYVNQYSGFSIDSLNMTVNGVTTLSENIADSGGLKQGYLAYNNYVRDNGDEPLLPGLNLTHEQAFFVSYAQTWCSKYRDAALRMIILTDSHSPNMYRVIGSLQNSAEFSEAFNCPAGSYMNPETKCDLW